MYLSTLFNVSSAISAAMTFAPSATKRRVVARPKPDAAPGKNVRSHGLQKFELRARVDVPVTIATFPARRPDPVCTSWRPSEDILVAFGRGLRILEVGDLGRSTRKKPEKARREEITQRWGRTRVHVIVSIDETRGWTQEAENRRRSSPRLQGEFEMDSGVRELDRAKHKGGQRC
jgi:hypothetical protein